LITLIIITIHFKIAQLHSLPLSGFQNKSLI
jgi:hypothetical protein